MKLKAAMKKYGVDKFAFTLLELCDKAVLIETEQKYIDKFDAAKKGYNLSPTAMVTRLGCKFTDEQRKKISIAVRASGYKPSRESIESMKKNLSKAVLQFDFMGGFVKEWPSATKAGESIGVNGASITNSCRTRTLKTDGFYWRYASDFEAVPTKIQPPQRFISQFDLNGSFIRNYPNINAARKSLHIDVDDVQKCISGRRNHVGGFMWTENETQPVNRNLKRGNQGRKIISIKNDLITEHASIAAASNTCRISEDSIRKNLSGQKDSVKGWIFKDHKLLCAPNNNLVNLL